MNKLYSVEKIRQLEQLLFEQQQSFAVMQAAGQAALECLQTEFDAVTSISVIAGVGNNGGDGYVLAALAKRAGLAVQVLQVGNSAKLTADAKQAVALCQQEGVVIEPYHSKVIFSGDLIVDALLGIGVKGNVKSDMASVIDTINQSDLPVLTIDMPSGLNADTGVELGACVDADVTITFIGIKPGMVTADGIDHCGLVVCDELGVTDEMKAQVQTNIIACHFDELKHWLPVRVANTHKNTFGHVLIVGGNLGYSGAVQMAALAAARVGAGMVSIATHPDHATALDVAIPEIMCHGIEQEGDLLRLLDKASVIVVGPGLGQDVWAKALLATVLANDKPVVVDADALSLIADDHHQHDSWVLTPHPGEAAKLLNCDSSDVQLDRFNAIDKLHQKYGGSCVLKGAGSLVCDSAGRISVCTSGNPGMATAGMGDILSGVIAGLMAQGLTTDQASMLGVCLHAQAGDLVAEYGERGLMATDLLDFLRELINVG